MKTTVFVLLSAISLFLFLGVCVAQSNTHQTAGTDNQVIVSNDPNDPNADLSCAQCTRLMGNGGGAGGAEGAAAEARCLADLGSKESMCYFCTIDPGGCNDEDKAGCDTLDKGKSADDICGACGDALGSGTCSNGGQGNAAGSGSEVGNTGEGNGQAETGGSGNGQGQVPPNYYDNTGQNAAPNHATSPGLNQPGAQAGGFSLGGWLAYYGARLGDLLGQGSFNPSATLEASRQTALSESLSYFTGQGIDTEGWDWGDINNLAQQKGYVTDPANQLAQLGAGQLMYHETSYDTPGTPWYSVMSSQDVDGIEQNNRNAPGWYAFTGNAQAASNEMGNAWGFTQNTGVTAAMNPIGDASLENLYKYATSLSGSSMTYEQRREAIYNQMRASFSDDQTLDSQGVGLPEFTTAQAGVCRHLSGTLFTAYNLAGVPTDWAFSDHHAWVQSQNEDGNTVTIDPNMIYNYHEFSSGRPGAGVYHYGGTYTVPGVGSGTYTPTGHAIAADISQQAPKANGSYCSLMSYCISANATVLRDTRDIFEFTIHGGSQQSLQVAVFKNDYFKIEDMRISNKTRAYIRLMDKNITGILFKEKLPLNFTGYYFVGKLNDNSFIAMGSVIALSELKNGVSGKSQTTTPGKSGTTRNNAAKTPTLKKTGSSSGLDPIWITALIVIVVIAIVTVLILLKRGKKVTNPP